MTDERHVGALRIEFSTAVVAFFAGRFVHEPQGMALDAFEYLEVRVAIPKDELVVATSTWQNYRLVVLTHPSIVPGADEWFTLAVWRFLSTWYNADMPHDHQHNPDPNANAARIVGEATASQPDTAADLEEAWAAWSSHIQKVDERGMALLRAAFDAGWEAGITRACRD